VSEADLSYLYIVVERAKWEGEHAKKTPFLQRERESERERSFTKKQIRACVKFCLCVERKEVMLKIKIIEFG
jgi:hypothetical protein